MAATKKKSAGKKAAPKAKASSDKNVADKKDADEKKPPSTPKEFKFDGGPARFVPPDIAKAAATIEKELGCDLWFLSTGKEPSRVYPGLNSMVDDECLDYFHEHRDEFEKKDVVFIVDSYGGDGEVAYKIARMVQRRCRNFVGIVPRMAKSAATLFLLGTDCLYLAEDSELGPLDVQYRDANREEDLSALDEVQAFEQINEEAMQTLNSLLVHLRHRTKKKDDVLLPLVLHYLAETLEPAFQGIDTVHFCQVARLLKVGEEYAVRLLRRAYPERAYLIATQLVRSYPTHGFCIDRDEAVDRFRLKVMRRNDEIEKACSNLVPFIRKHDCIGRIVEVAK